MYSYFSRSLMKENVFHYLPGDMEGGDTMTNCGVRGGGI